jgi:septal ring factor EnvC (AmiA/AmiB activator)
MCFCSQAHPGAEQDSLVNQASKMLADSTSLLSHAKQKADQIEKLKLNLEEQKEEVKNVRNMLTEAAKADNDISRQLQKLDNKEGKASHVCRGRIFMKHMLLSHVLHRTCFSYLLSRILTKFDTCLLLLMGK